MNGKDPQYIINSQAPIRICDNGGWTDTWFAKYGSVFNIAVSPCAEVQIEVYERSDQASRVIVNAENYGERYSLDLDGSLDRHPLLEATIHTVGVPDDISIEVTIFCQVPAGASTGTSAAVCVALIGALDYLTAGRLTAHEAASTAHKVETEVLEQQSGIQDQLCSAYGGVNFIRMHQYPDASVKQVEIPEHTLWELERQLALVFLGRSHSSSQVHEMVITSLELAGPDCRQLNDLRATAEKSSQAVAAGDLQTLGTAMIENTEAQRRLHPALIGRDAAKIIEIAREYGALGWKVNGAGGEGGSVTILCSARSQVKRAVINAIQSLNAGYSNIPISLSPDGLRTWKTDP